MPGSSPRLSYNIIANYASAGWNALMSFFFIPWYIRYLGIEAYGIIGFFASIQSVLYLLDMGLSLTFSREVAALSAKPEETPLLRNLVRTFASVYWGIAVVAGLFFAALTPLFSNYWLKSEHLAPSTITKSALVMGLVIVARWPGNIYSGGLNGLQRQVDMNIVNILSSTLRGVGAVVVLRYLSPTLYAFFLWQLLVSLMATAAFRTLLNRRLPADADSRFEIKLLRQRWRFAAGMLGINAAALLLSQLDKLLLSRMVSLEEFGYYAIASSLGGAVYMAVSPIAAAYFPRLTAMVEKGRKEELASAFHDASQLVAFVLVPAALVVAFYSREVLFLWTRNAGIAERVHVVLSIVILGSLMNALVQIPYQSQLAHGWTGLALYFNLAALGFMVPLIVALTQRFGIAGGAWSWLILNSSYVLIEVRIMFMRIHRGEMRRWYLRSVGLPLATTAAYLAGTRYCLRMDGSLVLGLAKLCAVGLGAYCLSALMTPVLRRQLGNWGIVGRAER